MLVLGLAISPYVDFGDNEPVQEAEAVAPVVVAGGVIVGSAAVGYAINEFTSPKTDVTGLSDDQAELEVYDTMLSEKGNIDRTLQSLQNTKNRSNYITLSEAKMEIVESLKNDETKAAALNDARTVVRDRYTQMQKSHVEIWNAKAQLLCNEAETARQIGTQDAEVLVQHNSTEGVYNATDNLNCQSGSIDLINGTNMSVTYLTYGSFNHLSAPFPVEDVDKDSGVYVSGAQIISANPSNSESIEVLNMSEWRSVYEGVEDQKNQTIDTLGNTTSGYLSDVYGQYSGDDFSNISKLLSPFDVYQNSVNQDELGSASWIAAQQTLAGYSGNLSATMTVSHNGTTTTGVLFSDTAPSTTNSNGTPVWETNTTYSISNFGEVFMVSTDGDIVNINNDFEITNISVDGESLSQVKHQNYDHTSLTAADLKGELEDINQQKEQLEETESDNTSGLPGDSTTWIIIALLGGAVLFLFVQNQSNNRKRKK